MEMNRNFWEDNRPNKDLIKYESTNSNDESALMNKDHFSFDGTPLNFSTGDEECLECPSYRKAPIVTRLSRQDPMSHRIIEKRRRDRMNNCLADLSRLIPVEYMKKGRGRVEKTEIIEMAIKHMKHLQYLNHYRLGYQECMSETMRFMVEVEGHFPRDSFCIKLLNHLQQHCDRVCKSTADTSSQHMPIGITTNENICESNNNIYEDHQQNENNNEKFGYKYKNDIKLRFNQDQDFNTIKISNDFARRNSCTSIENQSSSISSPSQSENCARMSSSEGESVVSQTIQRTPVIIKPNNNELKTNFGVPVFILHSKGSYYIPITLDYQVLLPHLGAYDLLNVTNDVSIHPVAINVNFQPPKPQINNEFPLG